VISLKIKAKIASFLNIFTKQVYWAKRAWSGWLILPIFCLILQSSGFILSPPSILTESASANIDSAPQVLGAAISLRGIEPEEKLIKSGDINLSEITAGSILVFDLSNGEILVEKNSSEKVSIASLTKLLTALVAYEQNDFNSEITITSNDTLEVKPALGFRIGDTIKTLDIFNAMLVGSANDAALVLAHATQKKVGTTFVELMNQKAASLGMSDSHFSNPMGFDSVTNYSTAQDLKKLITETQKLAVFTNLGKKLAYKFTGSSGISYYAKATNKLLERFTDLEAIKTGHTLNSQGAMASKLLLQNKKIILIILESKSREKDTIILRDQILKSYKVE
jgi:serine-type D-Ala-D-Ala carboxypeptidase (penicillin-binding protein 5/6)